MAQDKQVDCPARVWTELTDADTTGDVSLSLLSDALAYLQATPDGNPPTTQIGLPLATYGDGWSEATIAEKFPGVAGAVRLWAFPPNKAVAIYISHG